MPGNKSLRSDMAAHVKRELDEIIRRDFLDASGKPLPERLIEERLGISQSVINTIRNWKEGKKISVGVRALIALRDYSHKSIDALLGLELPLAVEQRQKQLDAIVAKSEELASLLAEAAAHGPKTKVGKLRAEIQTLIREMKQQREQDERVRRINAMPVPASKRAAGA